MGLLDSVLALPNNNAQASFSSKLARVLITCRVGVFQLDLDEWDWIGLGTLLCS